MTVDDVVTSPAPAPRRRSLLIAVLAVAVLVAGIVVFVLGRGSASSASDDLATARRKLHTQQEFTMTARTCARQVRSAVPGLVTSGQGLLYIAGQIEAQDEALVAGVHDQQAAGISSDIGSYNAAANRVNAAGTAANGLIDAVNQQVDAFSTSFQTLPGGCAPTAA